MNNWGFYVPTRIHFGWGQLEQIKKIVDELGGKKIFLVTGKRSAKESGTLDRLTGYLKDIPIEVFAEVEENPSIETVDRGAAKCKETGCDLVIGLGGGSPLDAAKAIAMLQKNSGSIREYLDQERTCETKGLPMIAITTTSGTGSEVTPFSVITHKEKRAKPAIAPPQIFPDVALVDPQLTMSVSPKVAASTGLDALCQAMEGFWSTQANPVTRALAFQGITLAMRNLESTCKNKDKESVTNMALASHLTGIQMSNIANTAIHPLSYPFTMDYDIPHGFACAIFLPAFIRFNASNIGDLFSDLLRVLELPNVGAFADVVDSLMDNVDAPKRLSEFGVKAKDIPALVKRGIGGSTPRNPRPVSEEDIIRICESIL